MITITERLSSALASRYRIERELGAGGMATVYLAQDLKHDRKVALKVLKPELAAVLGAERFVVEIKTTASLQHPHILPLFDSGTADGFLFYVMPFIDGETLRDKLNRETQLGVEEAVRIAREVADALDYAHRHGVIHRDIKPENILLHDGRPMVADFGIALAVSAAAGGRMTETGLSLGTPHYMSPEQATAEKEITARSDVYSLGSVLYEMLTGNPPHVGSSAQQIIMKIITEQPKDVTAFRKSVPSNVAAAVAKSLEKLPADRFATAKAFAEALGDANFGSDLPTRTGGSTRALAPRMPAAARRSLLAGAALAALGLAAAGWGWRRTAAQEPRPPVAFTLDVDVAESNTQMFDISLFDISPDGDAFVVASRDGLALRSPGQREFHVVSGTRGGVGPVFSPDGQWILFTVSGNLRRVSVAGGATLAILPGDSVLAYRPHWGEDGSIVFQSLDGIRRIPPEGGSSRLIPNTREGLAPRLLPDGSGILYLDPREGFRLMLYDLVADTAVLLLGESGAAQYVATGHIVFGHSSGGLFAVPFDRKRRAVTGAPIPLVNDILVNAVDGVFAISRSGTLLYNTTREVDAHLVSVGANRRIDTLPLATRPLGYVRFSPDGRSLAMSAGVTRGLGRHVALYDLANGAYTQLTFEGGGHSPVWSPDGRWIAFSSQLSGGVAEDLYVQPVDRSKPARLVARIPGDQHATAWPAANILAFASESDLLLIDPFTQGATPRVYLNAAAREAELAVSPDGRLAAYTSNESGVDEVFVRSFPQPGAQTKISQDGGGNPRWSPDGRTIYYQSGDGIAIVAARVQAEPRLMVLGRDTSMKFGRPPRTWDMNPRTGRIVATQETATRERMVVIVNWLDGLRGRGRTQR